jgi:hypothetical protein
MGGQHKSGEFSRKIINFPNINLKKTSSIPLVIKRKSPVIEMPGETPTSPW